MADATLTQNPSSDNAAKATHRDPLSEVENQCQNIDRLCLLGLWVLDSIDDDQRRERVQMMYWLSDQIGDRTREIRSLVKAGAAAERAHIGEASHG